MSIRGFPKRAGASRYATKAACVAAVAGLFIAAPVSQQTRQETGWCSSITPDLNLQIKGCTALIQSSLWSGNYVAFAYNIRGQAYQGNGDFDRAISDYSEAIRLDPTYVFAHYDSRSEYHSAELKGVGLAP
jgi:tetratricopeptide (TPR) repeat protein